MVFIRPTILRTAMASQGLTQDRYDYLRDQQELSQLPWTLILPGMPAPISPELKLETTFSAPAVASPAEAGAAVVAVPAQAIQ